MPVMFGDMSTRLLRSRGFTAPILGVTGDSLPEDVEAFKAAGATEVRLDPDKLAFVTVQPAGGRCAHPRARRVLSMAGAAETSDQSEPH